MDNLIQLLFKNLKIDPNQIQAQINDATKKFDDTVAAIMARFDALEKKIDDKKDAA